MLDLGCTIVAAVAEYFISPDILCHISIFHTTSGAAG